MSSSTENSLLLPRAVMLLLLCVVAIAASYVESRNFPVIKPSPFSTKP